MMTRRIAGHGMDAGSDMLAVTVSPAKDASDRAGLTCHQSHLLKDMANPHQVGRLWPDSGG